MCETKVVHWKKARFDIDIRRPAKWGNPFRIGKDGTRKEVIIKYENWLVQQPHLMADIMELDGKTLGCWCHPKPCHGDVLVKVIKQIKYQEMMDLD